MEIALQFDLKFKTQTYINHEENLGYVYVFTDNFYFNIDCDFKDGLYY